ncbi:MAG: rhomboid family intramembrane serine protease [Acidobacteriia bacterium]|nr:rhomboid family intramembrane serine protease [Terriglobia bacterium]
MSYYRHAPNRTSGSGLGFGFPPVTPVTRAIMIACGIVWSVQFLLGPVFGAADLSRVFGIVPPLVVRGYVWQPFTYMFLHSPVQISHLLLNLLILWMVGGDLERHWGGRRYLTYYVVCGAGAGVFVTVAGLLSGTNVPTIGASGAIYGLLLAYGIIFAERMILFMLIFPMRARTLSWVLFAIAFVSAWGQSASGVSYIAHLGGMVVGYLYLKKVWRVRELYRDLRWRLRRRKFRVAPPDDRDRWVN